MRTDRFSPSIPPCLPASLPPQVCHHASSAIQLRTEDAKSWYRRAVARRLLGQLVSAQKDLERCDALLRLNPETDPSRLEEVAAERRRLAAEEAAAEKATRVMFQGKFRVGRGLDFDDPMPVPVPVSSPGGGVDHHAEKKETKTETTATTSHNTTTTTTTASTTTIPVAPDRSNMSSSVWVIWWAAWVAVWSGVWRWWGRVVGRPRASDHETARRPQKRIS